MASRGKMSYQNKAYKQDKVSSGKTNTPDYGDKMGLFKGDAHQVKETYTTFAKPERIGY